jgi:hypothetical protein
MKYISLIAVVVLVLVAAFFVPPMLDKTSNPYNQKGDDQSAASDTNSFSVKKAFDDRNASFNSNDIRVERGKRYLLTKVDGRIKQLNPFRARVENMPNIKSDDKASLVAELNAVITQFESFKPQIEKSQTKEDIRTVADKIKVVWIKSSASVKNAEDKIIALKENQLILDADTASAGIQKRIDALKATGKETKEQEKLLAEYGKKITEAKQNVQSANEKYLEVARAASEGEKAVLMKDTNQLLKNAREDIKDAYTYIAKGAREEFASRYK